MERIPRERLLDGETVGADVRAVSMALVIVLMVAAIMVLSLISSFVDPTLDVHRLARRVEQSCTEQHVGRDLAMGYSCAKSLRG